MILDPVAYTYDTEGHLFERPLYHVMSGCIDVTAKIAAP
jgi:hypothetical protein